MVDAPRIYGLQEGVRTVGGGDCVRLCISAAWGVPYELTPEVFGGKGNPDGTPAPEFQRAYEQWAAERGYRWWISDDVAPVHLPRWLASVPALSDDGGRHCVVMEHDHLWFDPSSLSPHPAYASVALSDVLQARWLEPSKTLGIEGTFEPIAGRPAGATLRPTHGSSTRLAWATRRVASDVGRNDPCSCGSGAKSKRCCGA